MITENKNNENKEIVEVEVVEEPYNNKKDIKQTKADIDKAIPNWMELIVKIVVGIAAVVAFIISIFAILKNLLS